MEIISINSSINIIFQELFGNNLIRRDIDVEEYYQAMKTLKTSGLDITVLILSHLLKVKTLVLVRDFLWKSVEADVNNFEVFLMLFTSGDLYQQVHGTKSN